MVTRNVAAREKKMYCTNCGKEIKDGIRFCTYCGKPVAEKKENFTHVSEKTTPAKSILLAVVIVLAAAVIGFAGFLVIYMPQKRMGSLQSTATDGMIIESSDRNLTEESTLETEPIFTGSTESSETLPDEATPEVKEELFVETFAVIPYYWGNIDVNEELAEVIMDNAHFFLNEEVTYLPIKIESGEAPTPVDLSFECIKAQDMASYFRCESTKLTDMIEDIYGKSIQLPLGEVNCVECQNDGQYLTEWGFAWHVSYEGWYVEHGELNFELADNELTISFPYTVYSIDGDSEWVCVTKWIANTDSFLGFTMTSIENTCQKRDLSYLTEEDIEAERLRIRDLIAAGGTEVIREEAGTDGLPWKKEYHYENGNLVFAFFYNATDRSEDYRFYFMDGVMIRWVIGTSPDQIQYNLSDNVLPEEWSEWEKTVLESGR